MLEDNQSKDAPVNQLVSQTGTDTLYTVQVKLGEYGFPFVASTGDIITKEWLTLKIDTDKCPSYCDFTGIARSTGYVSYDIAQAARWGFIADNHHRGVITRLRKVKLNYTYAIIHNEYVDEITPKLI